MPSEETVQMWLQKIGDGLGVVFRYTVQLGNTLVHRAQHLSCTVWKFQGGRQRANFLRQTWKLRVKTSELSAQALMQQNDSHSTKQLSPSSHSDSTVSLTQQNDQLTSQIHSVTEQNDELIQQNLSPSNQPVFLNRSTL